MASKDQPRVSIRTPVYNGEKYLAECIESVLAQTYTNWDYTIVNNCSTDGTLEIARKYAERDARISIHNNDKFLDIASNTNKTFSLISESSKYCKLLAADDWMFPECVMRMTELAEANPSVAIVGSYQLTGGGDDWSVMLDGLPAHATVIPGREICRRHLMSYFYVFGDPTSSLYRCDLIRATDSFLPNLSTEADTSAYFKYLQFADYGFVHQVLSFRRIHSAAETERCLRMNTYTPSRIRDLLEYGPNYLTEEELETRLKKLLWDYYWFFAVTIVNRRNIGNKDFWNFHRTKLKELGHPFSNYRLLRAIFFKMVDVAFNLKLTAQKALRGAEL